MLSRFASNEHEQRIRLQEQIETLAKQHSNLEHALCAPKEKFPMMMSDASFRSAATSAEQQPRTFYFVAKPRKQLVALCFCLAFPESDDETFHDANDELFDADDFTIAAGERTGDSSSRHDSLAGDETDTSSKGSAGRGAKLVSRLFFACHINTKIVKSRHVAFLSAANTRKLTFYSLIDGVFLFRSKSSTAALCAAIKFSSRRANAQETRARGANLRSEYEKI